MLKYCNALFTALLYVMCACQSSEIDSNMNISNMMDQISLDSSLSDLSLSNTVGNGAEADQGMSSMAPDMQISIAPKVDFCNENDLESRVWQMPDDQQIFGSIAGDFALETIRGSWRLSENWSGCESYVFFVYFPDLRVSQEGAWAGDQLWESDVTSLLKGPDNTHYFFISYEDDPQARNERMVNMYNRFIRSLNAGEELPERRLHFVTERVSEIEGSIGQFFNTYLEFLFDLDSAVDLGDRGNAQAPLPFVFGIDRFQRWDSGGSLDEVIGRPMLWKMASYIAPFYNYMSDLYEQAATDGSLEVNLVNERLSERVFNKTIELPSPELMARYNTLEVDVSVTCPHQNVYACSEWDRIARIGYCTDSECEDHFEIARWITPYWRRGERRWIWDASSFLSWLKEGGTHSFHIELGPSWERATERDVVINLRLGEGQPTTESIGAQLAFQGGEFNETYNDRGPFNFTPPTNVNQVELVILLSGHGQTSQDNCAEWCDHRHHFSINDTQLPTVEHNGTIGSVDGCAHLSDRGVSPGQFGNWAPERAFWCPGLPVTPIRIDLSEFVVFGEENTLKYRATIGDELEPRGGQIALSAYVVYSAQE